MELVTNGLNGMAYNSPANPRDTAGALTHQMFNDSVLYPAGAISGALTYCMLFHDILYPATDGSGTTRIGGSYPSSYAAAPDY